MISGQVTGSEAVVAKLGGLAGRIRAAALESLKRQAYRVQAATVSGKLSGDPLHRRTGNLASSVNVRDPDDAGDTITARVGTNVRYARPHEYGGEFQIPAHTRKLTQVFGRSVAQRIIDVRAHTVTFPERSFLRSTLRELRPSILGAIRADVARATREAR